MSLNHCSWNETLKLAVKQKSLWAVYFVGVSSDEKVESLELEDIDNTCKFISTRVLAIYPGDYNATVAVITGGLFFFDSEAEMDAFYDIFASSEVELAGLYACSPI